MPEAKKKRRIHPYAAMLALCLLPAALVGAQISLVNSTDDGIAIKGYDPVAYFTLGAAVEGSEEYSFQWGRTPTHPWQFPWGLNFRTVVISKSVQKCAPMSRWCMLPAM